MMEASRAAEALLRHAQPLMPFLAPAWSRSTSSVRAANAISRHFTAQRSVSNGQRAFSTTVRRHEGQPKTSTPPTAPTETATESISQLLDATASFGNASSSRKNFQSSNRMTNRSPALGSYYPRSGDSASDLFNSVRDSSAGRVTSTGSSFSAADLNSIWNPSIAGPPLPLEDKPFTIKLGPTVGRTVNVDTKRGTDVASAFRQLDIQCNQNRVRADFNRQRFHERPGLKRKRLRRERWRRRFQQGFNEVVQRVQKMRTQGW
ncbi:Hypothetical protein R9X50_00269800 [Acrodontium crateriforme]|uniref:Ribosomal protein S21 n=1 Tax=Acrodontium crateriforme TaxID=150365 RepID=A0AAQ3R6W2_9PEZI|nr:Hypothetical protein R9X50_00269800 [Acrodontium crateriforme]